MRVFKFGGASVKDAEGVKNIIQIIQNEQLENGVIVISAMGKMTNAFEKIVESYLKNESISEHLHYIRNFHTVILDGLFEQGDDVYETVNVLLGKLSAFLASNQNKEYGFVYDQVVSTGEMLSTKIVSRYLTHKGILHSWENVTQLIVTDQTHRDAKINWIKTQQKITSKISPNKLYLVQGFLGGSENQVTTTLGREGSDYTAGVFAYCLNADSVTIWKDVEGVLNADPRVFENTKLIEQISYEEAIEMAFYGASVIHPKTIQPLQNKEIPLYVRSFTNIEVKGTEVSRGVLLRPLMPCFIVKKNQIMISISTRDFSFMVENSIGNIFKLLHKHQLKVNLIQNSAISFTVCVDNKFNHFDSFLEILNNEFKTVVVRGVDLYTVRHFTSDSLNRINNYGKSLLTQINKETAQIIVSPT